MKSKPHLRFYTHLLLTSALMLGGGFFISELALAAGTPAGTTITNEATGSFEGETSGSTGTVTSNTVTISVLEVAGITVEPSGVTEAPAGVTNAGTFQGVAEINTGDIVYFDFTVTNVGNDPTAFFIPDTATISGGTLDSIKIIEVDPDGVGAAIPKTVAANVGNIPNGGINTVTSLGATDGYIPINGSIKVRVAVKVTASFGQTVTAKLGDTPAEAQNQAYSQNGTNDLYTEDLANNTPNPYTLASFPTVSQVTEAAGDPINGDATFNRQEASALQTSTAIVEVPELLGYKSVNLTNDPDNSGAISTGDTLTWKVIYANTGTIDIPNFQIKDRFQNLVDDDLILLSPLVVTVTGNQCADTTSPTLNSSYTGKAIVDAPANNVLTSGFTLKSKCVVTVEISTQVGAPAVLDELLYNQAIAIGDNLPIAGIKTDNIDKTNTNLPLGILAPVDIPTNSNIPQIQTANIDRTEAKVGVSLVSPNPKLVIAKRITAVNNVAIANFLNDGIADSADDDPNWPADKDNSLRGAVTASNVTAKPSDRLEYTIYFLVSGNKDLTNITICDLIPPNTTFVNGAYDSVGNGSNLGIAFGNSTTNPIPTTYLTSVFDVDRGQFYPAGSLPPSNCKKQDPNFPNDPTKKLSLTAGDNTNGLVVVNVIRGTASPFPTLPHAISPGFPVESYGFVRFQVQVK